MRVGHVDQVLSNPVYAGLIRHKTKVWAWLTPSHTKTGRGRKLRHYVSHRLICSSGQSDPSGWWLPAPELETLRASQSRQCRDNGKDRVDRAKDDGVDCG